MPSDWICLYLPWSAPWGSIPGPVHLLEHLVSLRSNLEIDAFALSVARVEGTYNLKQAIYVPKVAICIRRHCASSRPSEVGDGSLLQMDLRVCGRVEQPVIPWAHGQSPVSL